MNCKQSIVLVLLSLLCCTAYGQVVGGQFSMQYLTLADGPHVSALGGTTVSNPDEDVSLVFQNPAMVRPSLHNQLALSNNFFYSGINVMDLQYAYHVEKINTSFAFGVKYLNYGNFTETDNTGTEYGTFHAADYALSLAASHQYGERWRYGATIKYAHSHLGEYKQSAVLTDVGINYTDTANLLTVGAVARNMGAIIKEYSSSVKSGALPFDLQLGISKQFKHLPLRLFATVHHLYEWDIRYDNPADAVKSTLSSSTDSSKGGSDSYVADKIFRHLILGAEVLFDKHFTFTVAYNHLRRQELAIQDRAGVSGFSFGAGIYLNKFQIHYTRSYFYIGDAYNEIGINMCLNKLFSIGNTGEKIHWNKEYKDWQ